MLDRGGWGGGSIYKSLFLGTLVVFVEIRLYETGTIPSDFRNFSLAYEKRPTPLPFREPMVGVVWGCRKGAGEESGGLMRKSRTSHPGNGRRRGKRKV